MTKNADTRHRIHAAKKDRPLKKLSPERVVSSRPYERGNMDLGGKLACATILIIAVSFIIYYRYQAYLQDLVRTPLAAGRLLNVTDLNMDEKFWGTYRPNTYFGLKTMSPYSPVVGLMWMDQFTQQKLPSIRHWCEQGDGIPKYGWLKHDGVHFGIQEIEERAYTITTEYVKRPGGTHGGDWTARIHAVPKNGANPSVVSFMFYIALEGQGHLDPTVDKNRLTSISGYSTALGSFELFFSKPSGSIKKFNHYITYTSSLDKLKESLMNGIKMFSWEKDRNVHYYGLGGRNIPRDSPGGPNFMVHQVTTTLPFEMEVVFESGSFQSRPNRMSGDEFSSELQKHTEKFDEKFSNVFQLKQKSFKENDIKFGQAALSNMIGGIGYFHGASIVQSRYNKEPIEYWKDSLLTAVPSRSFFPRGFLWDEGFHNILISKWDKEISKSIISHWMDLMNTEGWIPREQILGAEARARVPAEFVIQRNENANPPTLFLPLKYLVHDMIQTSKETNKAFLTTLYMRLKTWYGWYNTTQAGISFSSYRWKGRDATTNRELNPKTLTSGLDDFPRASHPTDAERHIDLRCWMALASGVMAEISKSLGMADSHEYEATYKTLTDNNLLDRLHWSDDLQQYSDYGLHSNNVKLVRPKPPQNLQPGQRPTNVVMEKIRVEMSDPKYQFVNSFGYISLFPFLLKIVDASSPKLERILKDMGNPEKLWTSFGLRSLSKSAPLYNKYNTEHDPPYWRGAIWININYLALGALYHYGNTEGPYKDASMQLYKELRTNIIENLMREYDRTGYIWEQYDDKTGKGKGSHPFTGWSALVVLVMAEEY